MSQGGQIKNLNNLNVLYNVRAFQSLPDNHAEVSINYVVRVDLIKGQCPCYRGRENSHSVISSSAYYRDARKDSFHSTLKTSLLENVNETCFIVFFLLMECIHLSCSTSLRFD